MKVSFWQVDKLWFASIEIIFFNKRPVGRSSAGIKTSERLINTDFDSWSWLQMFGGGPEIYIIDADHIIKSQGCPSSGPCRSIESQQDEINLSWNNIGPEGAKPDVWHNSLWLQVSENHVQ